MPEQKFITLSNLSYVDLLRLLGKLRSLLGLIDFYNFWARLSSSKTKRSVRVNVQDHNLRCLFRQWGFLKSFFCFIFVEGVYIYKVVKLFFLWPVLG